MWGTRYRSSARVVTVGLGCLALLGLALAAPLGAQDGPTVVDEIVITTDHGQGDETEDEIQIEATLFLPAEASVDEPVPLVLRTHGWAGERQRDPTGFVDRLLDEGYAVLTWDSRGFGCSGGLVHIDKPDVEGRDVSALIDWVVAEGHPIATDDDGDPIVGMSGGSYAGGIQLSTSAVDDRLDALAPEIAWSDLRYSLYAAEVVKQGWVAILYGAGVATATAQGEDPDCAADNGGSGLHPQIHQGFSEFMSGGRISEDTLEFFAASSVAHFGEDRPVEVPTLVVQGSVDTLFDLTDGAGIGAHVAAQGDDVRYLVYCGGHVSCPAGYAGADDGAYVADAVIGWFDRYLKGDEAVDTGSPVTYRTNEGEWRDVDSFPHPDSRPVDVIGEASGLPVVPVLDFPGLEDMIDAFQAEGGALPPNPLIAAQTAHEEDPRAARFEVLRAGEGGIELLGIPSATVQVEGDAVPLSEATNALGEFAEELPALQIGDVFIGELEPLETIAEGAVAGLFQEGVVTDDEDVHVFVRLVHREADHALNLQEGAVRVSLNEGPEPRDVPMPGVAYTIPEGDHLDIEVATMSTMNATGRTPAIIDVELFGEVPVVGQIAEDDDDESEPPPTEEAAIQPAPMPATGGGAPLVALLLIGAAVALALRVRS